MTSLRNSPGLSLTITACLPLCLTAATTPHYWNAGGDGVWGTGPADTSWNTSVGAITPNYAWPNTAGSVAVFQDNIGGTAAIFGQVSATGVQQAGPAGYTIEGGTLNLIAGSGGEQPFIAVETGTMNVSSALTGSAGLIKTGAGVLNLSGLNSYTGATAINGGTLVLAGPNQLPDGGALSIAANGTLTLAAGPETVASLVSNGGTINGTGTLTAATYALNDGSSVSANLGNGAITTNGTVVLSGNAGSGTLEVASGALHFTGTSAATTVQIKAGAILRDAGNLADAAMLENTGGTLFMQGPDTILRYTSNGGTLSGQGTLTAANYVLGDGSSVSGNLGDGVLDSSGAVSITGTAGAAQVNVNSGVLSLSGNNLSDAAAVKILAGSTLMLGGSDTVGSLLSNGGTIAGAGTLTAATYTLNDGTQVTGHLGNGVLDSSGAVSITGTAGAAQVNVNSGVLSLGGNNLSDAAAVQLAAGTTLMLGGSDTVGSLLSNGGTIAGAGSLTAASYILNDGTLVTGHLGDGVLETHGTVGASGSIVASTIRIVDGSFVNNGTLGTAGSWIDIGGGAWLVAGGTQNFARLTTGAGGVGGWAGNLATAAIISPGGDGAAGTLLVQGDFSTAGTLALDVGATGYDLVQVTGNANFGGLLEVHQLGVDGIESMVPLQVVQAASYSGNFSALNENLDGVVFFNPSNGTLTRLDFGEGAGFLGRVTPNQASTWTALYDDVIAPGLKNVFYRPGQNPPYELTSGIASADAPGLLAALEASLSPAGLVTALLNRLSPEVYGSLSDYSLQALRHHHRSARSAPTLAASGTPIAPAATGGAKGGMDAKGGLDAKGGAITAPAAFTPAWEVFAAADYFDTGTDGSLDDSGYDLSGAGIIAGARFSPSRQLRFSAWLAGDDGRVDGAMIDADAKGFAMGLGGEAFFPAGGREIRLSAGIAYGTWEFDGNRSGASATAGGWSPAFSPFSDVDADAFDAFIGIDSVVWRNETFRISPSMGLVFSSASSDAFREAGASGAGDPIALAVDGAGRDSLAAQFGISAVAEVNRLITLDGETGVQMAIGEETERISGRFAAGSSPMAAILTPLTDDYFYLGAGATWHASENCDVRLGYRAEIRSEADVLNAVNLSASVRF